MRIGIDITDLTAGIVGVGTTILNMIRSMVALDHDDTFIVYQNDDEDYCVGNNIIRRRAQLPLYRYYQEQVYFGARSWLDNLDVFHAPIHLPPVCHSPKTKIVMTVFDLHTEIDPERYPPGMKEYFIPRRARAIERADAVIVHADAVRSDVCRLCNINEEKIHVLYLGVDERFRQQYSDEQCAALRNKYQLPERFILFVGSIEPWKRVPLLIETYLRYRQESNDDIHLVIVGRRGWNTDEIARVEEFVDTYGSVHWYNAVSPEDLPLFYQMATVFASASIREGFGLIFIESMMMGAPVVGISGGVIPEIVGDAGILCDADDQDGFVQGLHTLLHDKETYQAFQEKGRTWAKRYSWDAYARGVLGVYKRVVG